MPKGLTQASQLSLFRAGDTDKATLPRAEDRTLHRSPWPGLAQMLHWVQDALMGRGESQAAFTPAEHICLRFLPFFLLAEEGKRTVPSPSPGARSILERATFIRKKKKTKAAEKTKSFPKPNKQDQIQGQQ